MEDLICTSLGLGFTNTQLRNMKASLRLRAGFSSGDYGDDFGLSDAPASSSSRSETLLSSKRSFSDFTSHPARDPSSSATKPPAAGSPPASDAKKFTGLRMPIAKSIVGASTSGAQDCDSTCEVCGIGGTPETGHRKFECPKLFAQEFPGKSMPGFTRSGVRIKSLWDGLNITAAMRAQWLRLHSLGFFTQPPFRKHPDTIPVMRV